MQLESGTCARWQLWVSAEAVEFELCEDTLAPIIGAIGLFSRTPCLSIGILSCILRKTTGNSAAYSMLTELPGVRLGVQDCLQDDTADNYSRLSPSPRDTKPNGATW